MNEVDLSLAPMVSPGSEAVVCEAGNPEADEGALPLAIRSAREARQNGGSSRV